MASLLYPWQTTGREVGPALPSSLAQGWITCAPSTRISSIVLPRQGAWPVLRAAGKGETNSPELMTLWASFLTAGGNRKQRGSINAAPMSPPGRWVAGSALQHPCPQGWLIHTLTTRTSSTVLPEPSTGPALPSDATGERWAGFPENLIKLCSYAHPVDIGMVPKHLPQPGTSPCSLVAI